MRSDGRKLKSLSPFFRIVPFIMDKRLDSQNFINNDVSLEPIDRYIRAKRQEGIKISHMALIISAYLHMLAKYPALNRFVANKRIYARNHICVCFVVLREGGGDDNETVVKLHLDGTENIFEVAEKVDAIVEENLKPTASNAMDKLLGAIYRVPGLASLIVWLCKKADKHGLLPRSIVDASPFHTSLFITNMASLRSNFVYHHLYEFGTTTMFMAIGKSVKRPEFEGDELVQKRYLPLGISTDERIVNGRDYVVAFREIERFMAHPELLEEHPVPKPDVE